MAAENYDCQMTLSELLESVTWTETKAALQLRVIDESGDDYLHFANYFAPIELPDPVRKAGPPPFNRAIDRDAGKRCSLPGPRHRGR